MGVGAGLYMCDVVKKVHVRYLISWWVLVYFLRGLSDFGAEAGACDLSADDFLYIYSVVTVNRNIVGYNK